MMMNSFLFWFVNYTIGIASVLFGMALLFVTGEYQNVFEMVAVAGAGSLLLFWSAYLMMIYIPVSLVA